MLLFKLRKPASLPKVLFQWAFSKTFFKYKNSLFEDINSCFIKKQKYKIQWILLQKLLGILVDLFSQKNPAQLSKNEKRKLFAPAEGI